MDGRPLLLLFLREVRERQPPADSICQDLDDLCDAVNGIPLAEHLESLGLSVVADTPEEFARFVATESEKMRQLVLVSGAKVD